MEFGGEALEEGRGFVPVKLWRESALCTPACGLNKNSASYKPFSAT